MRTLALHGTVPSPSFDHGDDYDLSTLPVSRVHLGPNLQHVAVVFDHTDEPVPALTLCWDVAAEKVVWHRHLTDPDEGTLNPPPSFTRDLKWAVGAFVGNDDHNVELCRVSARAVRPVGLTHHHTWVWHPTFDPAERFLYAGGFSNELGGYELLRWDAAKVLALKPNAPLPKPDPKWRVLATKFGELASAITFSADGRFLAYGTARDTIRVHQVDSARSVAEVTDETLRGKLGMNEVRRLALSPDGSRLAVVRRFANTRGRPFRFGVYDLPAGTPAKGFTEKALVYDAAFSPDGRTLLTACADGTVGVWDTASRKKRRALDWGVGPVRCVTFAEDGLTAACGVSSGQVVVWDADD